MQPSPIRNGGIIFHVGARIKLVCSRRASNAMTRGNSTSEIFPENFRRVTLAYFGSSDGFASGFAAVWDLTNPTARHADGINRIDVARIRPILGYYVSTLAVTFYLAAAFRDVASVQNLCDITLGQKLGLVTKYYFWKTDIGRKIFVNINISRYKHITILFYLKILFVWCSENLKKDI